MRYLGTILVLNLCLASLAWPDAIAFFREKQAPTGGWDVSPALYADGAGDGLIVWAALVNGVSPKSPWLHRATDNLMAARPKTVFSRAMRIMAMTADAAAADRKIISEDVAWLSDLQSPDGGWPAGRDSSPDKLDTLDTAWAVLALDRAQSVGGVAVNKAVFQRAVKFFQTAVNDDDGYGYDWPKARPDRLRGQSHSLTTAAAIAALDVLNKYVGGQDEDADMPESLADSARGWLSGKDSPMKIENWYWGSQPLGQYRYFLARATVDRQAVTDAICSVQDKNKCTPANGLAEGRLMSTAWAILTLAENSSPKTAALATTNANMKNSDVSLPRTYIPKLVREIYVASWSPRDNYPSRASEVLADELRDAYSLGLECIALDSPDKLEGQGARLLWCTGFPAEIDIKYQSQLLRFIADGGVVLLDSADDVEYDSAASVLRKMFGDAAFYPVTASMPLATGNFGGGVGLDVTDKLGCEKKLSRPLLMAVVKNGRTVAVLSAVPLAKIASGNFVQDNPPMQSSDAKEILLNIILFADTQ